MKFFNKNYMYKDIFFQKLKAGITSVYQEIERKEEIYSLGIYTDQDTS